MFSFWQEPFLWIGLAVGLISGLLCALMGFFVILKRMVFIGIAISQIAGLGVVLGLMAGLNPYISSFILSVTISIFFWLYNTERDIPKDTVVAFIYLISAGLTTILIAKNPRVEVHGFNVTSGNLLYVTTGDLVISLLGGIFVLLLFLYFFRALVFISYDRETALTSGIEGTLADFLFYLLLGIIVSISIRTSGLLFVFASMIIPPMTAFKIFTSVNRIITGSLFITGISVISGFWLSYNFDLPTSPLIICIYGLFFVVGLAIKRGRFYF
ncbi:MAG: metal ABC transporter permease [Candidatus Omnitrophica bacterium]|nr:metal ABC transporter permease [Candidatus Omnitrophota bacterium]